MTQEIKIYVGTYGQYNSGSLFGKWFDLSEYSDAEELFEAIAEYHKDEHDPEYMIQDVDTDLKFVHSYIGECSGQDDIQRLYDFFEECEESHLDMDIITAYCDAFGYKFNEVKISYIEEAYSGSFDSDEDFAEDMAEQCGDLDKHPHWPYTYIDWERAARELMYDYVEQDGHYFRNC